MTNPTVRLRVGHQQSQFWPILVRLVHYYSPFWGPRAIYTICDPRGAFMCRSSTLTILANSGRLVDYYSLFWGPGVISTIDEPLGAFTCRSSTLAGFVDSDPFRGLLLTVLGSQRDFHFCRTPRCACVLVVKTRSFGRFWPVFELLHSFGIPK